jgi:hypothetical protein
MLRGEIRLTDRGAPPTAGPVVIAAVSSARLEAVAQEMRHFAQKGLPLGGVLLALDESLPSDSLGP